ncbi:MAG: DUF2318 domain-containing protein [Spirochaetales bacterium]|nr:DUF2318 domain-containing protein [Spirochaetales bacterium]
MSKTQRYNKKIKNTDMKRNSVLPKIIIGGGIVLVLGVLFLFSDKGKALIGSLFPNSYKEVTVSSQDIEVSTGTEVVSAPKTEVNEPRTKAAPAESSKTIEIPISRLSREAQYFSFKTPDNIEVKYFALLDADNKPHIAFDACDVCYRSKRGYAQSGDMTVCRNCGNQYPIQAIGTENQRGGCWPSYLPMTEKDGKIAIKVDDLIGKQWMF